MAENGTRSLGSNLLLVCLLLLKEVNYHDITWKGFAQSMHPDHCPSWRLVSTGLNQEQRREPWKRTTFYFAPHGSVCFLIQPSPGCPGVGTTVSIVVGYSLSSHYSRRRPTYLPADQTDDSIFSIGLSSSQTPPTCVKWTKHKQR